MKSILKVTVTTAVKLTKKQADSIVNAVEKKQKISGENQVVELKQVIEPSVIAGIKLSVGSQEIDATTYTKLEKLHTQLRENI